MKNLEKKDRAKIAPSYKQRHKPKPKIVRNSGFCPFLHCTALQGVCHWIHLQFWETLQPTIQCILWNEENW